MCLDDRGDLMVVNLGDRRVASWSPPGGVGAVASDAALDYVILGMLNGESHPCVGYDAYEDGERYTGRTVWDPS